MILPAARTRYHPVIAMTAIIVRSLVVWSDPTKALPKTVHLMANETGLSIIVDEGSREQLDSWNWFDIAEVEGMSSHSRQGISELG